jgi:hypothetical protein
VSQHYRISICLSIIMFATPATVLAMPGLPSSFYGTVRMNNGNVMDGMVVQAFLGDLMVAQGYTQKYQGGSVYSLSVPADDTGTSVIEGGREGDKIIFKVGGILANETGTWHSATNVPVNLTITSTSTPWATL